MGVPTNAHLTYSEIGIREDLGDMIFNIDPVETQFTRALRKGPKPLNTKVEWLTESLASAASNAQLEGNDVTIEAVVAPTRVYNNCQISTKSFAISGTEEEVKLAGRKSAIAHQTSKKGKELAKDIEYRNLREVRQDGAAATARKCRGALNWCTTNLDKASDATLNADGSITGGTARALTESLVLDTLQNIWSAGGNPKQAFMGPYQKRQFSAFAGTGNYRRPIENTKIVNTVDVYVHDFGMLALKPHRIMPTDTVFFPDMQYWKARNLRPVRREQIAKSGDSEKYFLITEGTLESSQEAASGRITNLTTSS